MIVPLLEISPLDDAARRVGSPTGYLCDDFFGFDPDKKIAVLISFCQGSPLDPHYMRCSDAFLAKPTHHTPPMPAAFPSVRLSILQPKEKPIFALLRFPKPARLDEKNRTKIGPNTIVRGDGRIEAHVQFPGSRAGRTAFGADLALTSESGSQSVESRFFDRSPLRPDHHWIVAHPRCQLRGQFLAHSLAISLRGMGHHDQLIGATPLTHGLRRWFRGHVFFPRQSIAFQIASPAVPGSTMQCTVAATRGSETQFSTPHVSATRHHRTAWGLRYPEHVDFDSGLVLREPVLLHSTPVFALLSYQAAFAGQTAPAFCQLHYPARLHSPLSGGFIREYIRDEDAKG